MATPLSVNKSRYSTRRNSVGLVNFIPDPKKVLRRRLNKLSSHRILAELGSESISDIHLLFLENLENLQNNNCFLNPMGDFFTQLNFAQIGGHPHDIPDKAIDKLTTYKGTDASLSAKQHIRNFTRHCGAHVRGTDRHEDVYMTLFSLSLDGKAGNWYDNLPDNSFATLADFKTAFLGKFGSKKEPRHLVAALTSMKKSDTETMDEFNNRFTKLTNSIAATHAPPAASTLDYYIDD